MWRAAVQQLEVNFLTSLNGCVRAIITWDSLYEKWLLIVYRVIAARFTIQQSRDDFTNTHFWWDNHENEPQENKEKIINKSDFGHKINNNRICKWKQYTEETRLANDNLRQFVHTKTNSVLLWFWWIRLLVFYFFDLIIIALDWR